MAFVPSYERSLYIEDIRSIIAYTWNRYCRMPANTIPYLSEYIISLPKQIAQYGRHPEILTVNMKSDLQNVFTRIMAHDGRTITVNTSYSQSSSYANGYDITVSMMYTLLSGELDQIGTTISLGANGRLVIPESNLASAFPL